MRTCPKKAIRRLLILHPTAISEKEIEATYGLSMNDAVTGKTQREWEEALQELKKQLKDAPIVLDDGKEVDIKWLRRRAKRQFTEHNECLYITRMNNNVILKWARRGVLTLDALDALMRESLDQRRNK